MFILANPIAAIFIFAAVLGITLAARIKWLLIAEEKESDKFWHDPRNKP